MGFRTATVIFLKMKKAYVLSTVLLALAASAQHSAAQESWNRFQIEAAMTPQRLVMDGVLDDVGWASAKVVSTFVQQEPNEGAPATERTEIRVLYDAETLYIGVRAFDNSGLPPRVTEMRRDSDRILDEDNIQIILDTFKDARSAYMFVTNPLGAKLDQQIFNEGEGAGGGGFGFATSNINRDWDGVWHVAAQTVPDGWVAEIAIPMVTLRFPDAPVQSWGLNIMRNQSRKNEQDFWAPVAKAYSITRVSQAGTLSGMSALNRGLDLRVTPYATGGATRILDQGIESDAFDPEVGIDVKFGVTAGLNLDVTINTDFAQAEVDDEQVNLTRFPLFFPEKRDFFLENSGTFTVGSATPFNRIVDLFFSRRIGISEGGEPVPIRGGARLTGKIGRNDIAIMDVQTDNAFGRSGDNFLVTRFSRNILSRSRVGGMFINRSETDGDHYNRTYAADFSVSPHAALNVIGFLGKTDTPGMTGDNMGSYVNATWLDDKWRIYGEFADLDDDFNPEVGFLPRRGIRVNKLHFERNPRPNFGGIRVLSPMMNWTYTTDQAGRRLSTRWHYMVGTRFDNGAFLNIMYNNIFERLHNPFVLSGVEIPAGDYDFASFTISFDSNPSKKLYYKANYTPQTFFGGDRTDVSGTVGVRLTDRLATEGRYSRNDVALPGGDFVVDLAALRVDFAVSPTMAFRSVTQYNSQTDQFGTSARFRYTYRPGSDIYLVYDEVRRDPTTLLEYRDQRLILKATYLLTR